MKYFIIPLLFFFIFTACRKRNNGENSDDLTNSTIVTPAGNGIASSTTPFKDYIAVNAFEWDVTQQNQPDVIDETRLNLLKSFSGIRHYLDWSRIEPQQGKYTFSPTHNGGWDYDVIYQKLKDSGIDVLIDLKTCPDWLFNTYPADQRDAENVPAPYGSDRSLPSSYVIQAKAGFQLAARYGTNKNVDPTLFTVDASLRWTGDKANTVKIGLGLIKYIECDNERDKWWKGKKAEQTPEEYAANMSAFYDGDKGKLGKNVGIKTADPNMVVVMGGLATADPNYVIKMIEWCKKNRGTKPDGTVDLCFDVINYHLYSNNAFANGGNATVGVSPELSNIGTVADKFIAMAKDNANNTPVWITETGYDIGTQTPQRAIAIGNKTSSITQADWNLRTSLLYARKGLKRCMFYMLDDVDINSTTQYSSSGFVNSNLTRRPSADYMLQTKNLLGNYYYNSTLSADPIVDLYKLDKKEIYVLTIPDQKGRTATYELNLGDAKQAIIHTLQPGKDVTIDKTVNTVNGKLTIEVSETPIFVEKL
ncbi:beta-galactosidase [Pedobacter paludis]|uniref:Glycoside hydrolase family 42 N-terminal domain-containing protein n=1 Tax=Pedobacter paludis TaxID=2203212 RepID=A0A317EV83_9SPHI|nr:beta-galactosidase [Pedobacter paludis]PWS30352.1 hypothetical protein DF947_18155 [Pedobacter paludis]